MSSTQRPVTQIALTAGPPADAPGWKTIAAMADFTGAGQAGDPGWPAWV